MSTATAKWTRSAPTPGANTLIVLTNDGGCGFALAGTPGVGSQAWALAAGDLNGDGKPDLISANSGDNTLTV